VCDVKATVGRGRGKRVAGDSGGGKEREIDRLRYQKGDAWIAEPGKRGLSVKKERPQ